MSHPFSFDLRNAAIADQQAATQEPGQNVHGQWYCGDRYFASEADARFWQKIEREKAIERQQLRERVLARAELAKHVAEMDRMQRVPPPWSMTEWMRMVRIRLELEARCEDLARSQSPNLARVLPEPPSRRAIEDAAPPALTPREAESVGAILTRMLNGYHVRLGVPRYAITEQGRAGLAAESNGSAE